MQVKEKIFILRKTRYGDNDLILNCLTPSGARVSLFARSALRSKKRFGGGVLEPTHYVHVLYDDRGRTEQSLHTLKEASLIDGFEGVRSDYARLELALHFVKLISEVVREGDMDSVGLFNLLGNALRTLESSTALDRLRTHFEVKLLSDQGVLPVEGEEAQLLASPISEHANIALSDDAWSRLRSRVRRVLQEYLEHTRSTQLENQGGN